MAHQRASSRLAAMVTGCLDNRYQVGLTSICGLFQGSDWSYTLVNEFCNQKVHPSLVSNIVIARQLI
jgi:hypothetical protein